MIEMKDVSVIYDKSIVALDHIDLTIDKGCYVVVGQNGSGKSTLLQTLVSIVDFQGEIKIDGILLDKQHMKEIRKKVGLIFQNPDHQLFMSRIYDDIAFGLINQKYDKDIIEQKIQDIAKLLNIQDILIRSSHQLSGGQKRMAAIATVLVMDPDIILMDEPTSFLDPKSRRKIIKFIQSCQKTMIIVTHDLDMALEIGDEVILIDQGKIIKQDKAHSLLTNKDLLEQHGLELPFCMQRGDMMWK